MISLSSQLEMLINGLGGARNAPMAQYTSFKCGGAAAYLVQPANETELLLLLNAINNENVPHLIIGNGTNLLISDKGINKIVVRIGEKFAGVELGNGVLRAKAGASFAAAAKQSVLAGYMGLEWAAGIPGTVGGAVAMNAGAYGGETANCLKTVTYYENGKLFTENTDKAAFGYRVSPYSKEGIVVVAAEFALEKDDGNALERMTDFNTRRKEKQPVNYPSAGSVFKRPQGNFAGALIEQAGLKGQSIGGAEVSTLHAGFIINKGGATSGHVYALIKLVQGVVYDKFGVMLEPEIRLIGEF